MGIYFNPGNGSFNSDIHSDIYIDKTGLISYLNKCLGKTNRYIAISHARRFGKSQAAGMIDAYYSIGSDSRDLFAPFEIAKDADFSKHLNKYNVIHIDVSSFERTYKDDIVDGILKNLYIEINDDFPNIIDENIPITSNLSKLYLKTNCQFVIIIDEWDCVVRNYPEKPDIVHGYLQFLHDLFKSEESKTFLALGYITGILPIKKIEDESALNNFKEFTMLDSKKLTPYFGFTENEVKALCKKYAMNFESIKAWYNGYLINGMNMYNPHSVSNAMIDKSIEPYWRNTSSFSTINRLINMNFEGIREDLITMLSGGKILVSSSTFQNDLSDIKSKDDAFIALIHLGYLGYDSVRGSAYIPNYEVATAFDSALKMNTNWKDIEKSISLCNKLLWATIDKEADTIAEIIEIAHETYTSVLKYNDENSLSCVLTMAYFTAPAYYTVVREMPTGKGFADFIFIPRSDSNNMPAIIIELKVDSTPDVALNQIKEKNYIETLKNYKGEIILLGISYGKDTKKHTCLIETVEC